MKKTSISILGCGWLGLPLAKSLLKNKYAIKGSTTSSEKISVLKNAGIGAFKIELSADKVFGEIDGFLQNSEILILDIPPQLNKHSDASKEKSFVKKIKNLIPCIEKSSVKKVIFISSTSVYNDAVLEDSIKNEITEENLLLPESQSGKQLVEAENILVQNKNFQTTVLRFGGLIGEDRNPVRFLSGKENIENANAPINLIHQDDCIAIISKIIDFAKDENLIYNAVTPFHPSRMQYYCNQAKLRNLELPKFEKSKITKGKTINSNKLITDLNYTFLHPEL